MGRKQAPKVLSERQQMLLLMRQISAEQPKPTLIPPKSVKGRNHLGETALQRSCIKGDIRNVRDLLKDEDVDIDAADNAGWTSLHEAALHGFAEIVECLLQAGANPDPKGLKGETPLHDAVSRGHIKVVALLVQYKADVNIANEEGKKATDFAKKIFHEETRATLLKVLENPEIAPGVIASIPARKQPTPEPVSKSVESEDKKPNSAKKVAAPVLTQVKAPNISSKPAAVAKKRKQAEVTMKETEDQENMNPVKDVSPVLCPEKTVGDVKLGKKVEFSSPAPAMPNVSNSTENFISSTPSAQTSGRLIAPDTPVSLPRKTAKNTEVNVSAEFVAPIAPLVERKRVMAGRRLRAVFDSTNLSPVSPAISSRVPRDALDKVKRCAIVENTSTEVVRKCKKMKLFDREVMLNDDFVQPAAASIPVSLPAAPAVVKISLEEFNSQQRDNLASRHDCELRRLSKRLRSLPTCEMCRSFMLNSTEPSISKFQRLKCCKWVEAKEMLLATICRQNIEVDTLRQQQMFG
eukprot:Nk52_evm11s227 gene=Nk52_evmTU11s227